MEQLARLSALLEKSSDEIGVHLSSDQLEQFTRYLEQLRVWNRSVNLTRITQDEEIVVKHFVDSLAALRVLEVKRGGRLLDVGTGAGFPGIPLRIARQDLDVTLVEPVQKKVSFLHYIVGLLRLDRVMIFCGTLEQFVTENAAPQTFDYITTRALTPRSILKTGHKLLGQGGKGILYLSRPINRSELGSGWLVTTEQAFDLPCGFGRRVISLLSPSPEQTN